MRRQRRPAMVLLAMVSAGLLGCVSGFDRNDQIVNSLRILAVGARVDAPDNSTFSNWADADAGDTVHLRALVANPGGLSTVTVTWLACLPIPGQTQPCTDEMYLRDPSAIIPLADDPTKGVLKLGTGVNVDYVVPDEIQPVLQGLLDRADQQINAQCALYTQIPLLVIAQDSANGAVFAAVKNLRLTPWKEVAQANNPNYQFYIRNQNPHIAGFNLSPTQLAACDGQPLATTCVADSDCDPGATCANGVCSAAGGASSAVAFPEGQQVVCLNIAREQSFYTCGLDGPESDQPNVPEQAGVIWYMTGGSLSAFPAPNDGSGGSVSSRTFTYFTRPPGPFTLYGVARDRRDGETWVAQDFQ